MLMPGRQLGQGTSLPGTTTTGSTTVNGHQLPVDMTVTERTGSEPVEYVAGTSVEFNDEFESLAGDAFEAYIADGSYAGTGNVMGGMTGSAGRYRYGFNGKENDNEVKGEGNQQDYGMRIYDPRIGRFLSNDPLAAKFPYYSPYHFSGNTPIWANDLDGMEPNFKHHGDGIYGVGNFSPMDLGSLSRTSTTIRIGSKDKQFQIQWLMNNNGEMIGYLASRVIPEEEYKRVYGGSGVGLQEAYVINRDKFFDFGKNSDAYYDKSRNAETYDRLWGELDRSPYQGLFDPRGWLLGRIGGASGKLGGQLMRTIPAINKTEISILQRSLGILNSKEFDKLRDAFENGVEAEVKIGGTPIVYNPEFSYAEAMTLHADGGFMLGPRAFKNGIEHTVLWEVTRLETQNTGGLGVNQTRGYTDAAQKTADKLLPFVKKAD